MKHVLIVCILIFVVAKINAQTVYGNNEVELQIEKNSIKSKENADRYALLSNKWSQDSLKSISDMFFLRCYFTSTDLYNPLLLDSLMSEIYDLNKNEKFLEAIDKCDNLIKICPFNMTSYKEKVYALQQLNKDYAVDWDRFLIIAKSMTFFNDSTIQNNSICGQHYNPFFSLSFEEGTIFYDSFFGSYPEKRAIAKYSQDKLMGVYFAHSSATRWSYLNHAKKFYLNPIDMTKEKE